ncbi:peptidylprolyl isomerase [Pseudoalteromonas sp. MMG013]|uniref:peptidylprolyl isomerase n=1 Tax=Pseudoalteromonas sp. MMG013 TaxID=2822687 RepID=UPI001B36EB8C|nr:peptidylprolyl isomerase [Pseudoalteromonas sp. MMG013]MBQ4862541.1 peptidylprolyl isomerase [Pseudoalteromonas sp. MMG013]
MNKIKELVVATALCACFNTSATIVEFQTTQGSFQVNLYDQITPETVDNFLRYVNQQRYVDSTVHRSVPSFVIQGGGYKYDGSIPLTAIETNTPVVNEPKLSNVRGTIAMAKLQNQPNSATSQWYINLKDNSTSLDSDNGGYTVFGEVIGTQGMAIVDKISNLNRCGEVPVVNYTSAQCVDTDTNPDGGNLVSVTSVAIIDSDPTTANDLSPPVNVLVNKVPTPTPEPQPTGSSSSGSLFFSIVLMMGVLRRRFVGVR